MGALRDGVKRREQYLAKANEADKQAAKTDDDYNRQVWKAIADTYRALALLNQKRTGDPVENNKSPARRK
jgi:hypothetical protein